MLAENKSDSTLIHSSTCYLNLIQRRFIALPVTRVTSLVGYALFIKTNCDVGRGIRLARTSAILEQNES